MSLKEEYKKSTILTSFLDLDVLYRKSMYLKLRELDIPKTPL